MPTFRAYLNKAKGNDHSRIIDREAADEDQFRDLIASDVKKSEVVGDVVQLAPDNNAEPWGTPSDAALEAMAQGVASELAEKMGLDHAAVLTLARQAVRRSGPLP